MDVRDPAVRALLFAGINGFFRGAPLRVGYGASLEGRECEAGHPIDGFTDESILD